MVAAGKLGLGLDNGGDDNGHENNGANGLRGKKAGEATENVPGGWMAAALSSGRLGVGPSGDNSVDFEDEPPTSQGVTMGTQTEENIGKEVAVPAQPKLPPWAKPWSPPTPAVVVNPASTPATEFASDNQREPLPGKGVVEDGCIQRATSESSNSSTQGARA